MSMAEPLLPDPSERDAPGPLGHGEAVGDDPVETGDAALAAPVHLSQSRLTPEELTQDLADEGADS